MAGQMMLASLATLALLALVWFTLRAVASWRQGYAWDEMDWQQKGSTSIADFMAASEIGKREVQRHGVMCIEYYAYKDGLAIKQVCPQ